MPCIGVLDFVFITDESGNFHEDRPRTDARDGYWRPVVVVPKTSNPTVVPEFEPGSDAVPVSFGVQDEKLLKILSGSAEPSRLLPLEKPEDMRAMDERAEDTCHDMRPHIDVAGKAYDFAFWCKGLAMILDERTQSYSQ